MGPLLVVAFSVVGTFVSATFLFCLCDRCQYIIQHERGLHERDEYFLI